MSEQKYEPITDFTTVIQEGDEFRYSIGNPWMPFRYAVGHALRESSPYLKGATEFRRPIKTTPQKWVVYCGDGTESFTTEAKAREQCERAARLGVGPAYYGILKGVCRSQVVWGDE